MFVNELGACEERGELTEEEGEEAKPGGGGRFRHLEKDEFDRDCLAMEVDERTLRGFLSRCSLVCLSSSIGRTTSWTLDKMKLERRRRRIGLSHDDRRVALFGRCRSLLTSVKAEV